MICRFTLSYLLFAASGSEVQALAPDEAKSYCNCSRSSNPSIAGDAIGGMPLPIGLGRRKRDQKV